MTGESRDGLCVWWDRGRERACRRKARTTSRNGSPLCWVCAAELFQSLLRSSSLVGADVDWMISYRLGDHASEAS